MAITTLLDRTSELRALDGPARAVSGAVRRVLPQPLRDLLHGTPIGHPTHPAIAALPVGAWTSAAVLDAVAWATRDRARRSGAESAATTLVATGLASAPLAALAGVNDLAELRPDQQRTGLVHGMANALAVGLFTASLVQRLRGSHGLGRALGLVATALATGGATLGGHLAYRWSGGPNQADHVPHVAPPGEHPVGPLSDFPDRSPVRRLVGEAEVVVVRDGDRVHALAARCAHLAGPLHEGEVVERDGRACLVCPWHGSTFALADGSVVRGPSPAPQPRFAAEVRDGEVVLRALTSG